jgi:hypothetical protein
MDIIWAALGICVLVGFVFYVLAQYWQRLLTKHSYAIRDLAARVQALEEMEDPNFRRKIGDSAPSPLEQVMTFGFRLGEQFWEDTLKASAEEIAHVKAHGKFLGSVKIERWRSHSVVTVYEVLPQSKSAEWESRSIDVYSSGISGATEPVTLWELPLAANSEYAPEPAPGVELRLVDSMLELRAAHGRFDSAEGNGSAVRIDEFVFFRIPLDAAKLGEYRKSETEDSGDSSGTRTAVPSADSWIAYFAHHDEQRGVDWQLCIRDLTRKEEWERWKVWEPWEAR